MSITTNLPFSPISSPSSDQTTFAGVGVGGGGGAPESSLSSGGPFSSTRRGTPHPRTAIRRINEIRETAMEYTEEMGDEVSWTIAMDNHTPDESLDESEYAGNDVLDRLLYTTFPNFSDSMEYTFPFISSTTDTVFRAGTPTPVITPPFPQVVLPTGAPTHEAMSGVVFEHTHLDYTLDATHTFTETNNAVNEAMEEEVGAIDDLLEIAQEISTEELDQEFLDVRRRNFWNSWLRYRYRKQQQQGIFSSSVGSEWSNLLAYFLESRPTAITEEDLDQGIDLQGLRWGFSDIPEKQDFREKRVKDYGSLIVKPPPQSISTNPAHDPSRIHNFYKFRYTNLQHRCSLHHFQLRYLLSATSKNDLYYIHDNSLRRWDTNSLTSDLIHNFKTSRQAPWKGWMPSTLSCAHNIAAIGGYSGEYAIIPLNDCDDSQFRLGSLADPQYITNHVDIIRPREGGTHVIWANNDHKIRQQDVETGQFVRTHELEWPVNATCTSPDGRIRVAVGDAKEVVLMDAARGDIITKLWGHNHWSFAVDWRCDGYTFVTGNQDMSARLWDARKMSESFLTLPGNMGAIRSVHFSPDGNYLAIAEPADYVHIYDASTGLYEDKQTIEYIGETAGVSFDPSGESLFIGNADDLVGSIYEFNRAHGKECVQSWEDLIL